MTAERMSVPTYDKCDTYVAGQYVFNYLRTFLAAAGIDASQCKLVIELPDRDTLRQLVSVLQREAKGPPLSAARIGNHSGIWQGVEYEFSVKGWNRLASSTPAEPDEPTENQEILSFHIIALRKQNEELLKTLQAAREYISDGRLQWNGPKDEYILARIDKAMSQRKAEPDASGERKC